MQQPQCSVAVVAVVYEGIARRLILGLKYQNRSQVAPILAELMAQRLVKHFPEISAESDVVTWAPTTRRRARSRGQDQSELLARCLARELGVPCKRLLIKISVNIQTGSSRAERLQGSIYSTRKLRKNQRVIVVDDVVTTGATMKSAALALREAGAQKVTCVAVASALRHDLRR